MGLEPAVGYLHEFSTTQTKESLVYDLQEPFRWLVDLCVVSAFESETLGLHDFYFTGDDYRYRFEAEAKQRFIDVLHDRFNAGITYKGRVLKWDTVIEQKVSELGRFLTGKSPMLDFMEPIPKLEGRDDREMRAKVLALTASQAKQIGIGEALVAVLSPNGVPTLPFATRLIPPATRMGPLTDAELTQYTSSSAQVKEYAQPVDRDSAREMLASRIAIGAWPMLSLAPQLVQNLEFVSTKQPHE